MRKFILILSLILIITAIAVISLGSTSSNVNESLAEESTKKFTSLVDSKEGVSVEITDILYENNKTLVSFQASNHIYDISGMDIEGRSSFNEIQPISYQILISEMGGHHVESILTFENELKGDLVINMNDDLIFKYNIL